MGSFVDMCKYNIPDLKKRIYKKIINSVEFERQSINKYFDAIKKLSSDFKDLKFIIRPHLQKTMIHGRNLRKLLKIIMLK